MHTHQSLWNDGKPLFYDETGYGGLSDIARWYIGGILAHAPAILAFTNPTLNSYHRLVKGFEAPVNLVYSAGNRSAATRIPITGSNPKATRIEFLGPGGFSTPDVVELLELRSEERRAGKALVRTCRSRGSPA